MIKRYQYETGYSSGLLSGNSDMQLRQQLRHRFDPFYTGQQKAAKARGRIDRFNKKYGISE